MNNLIIDPGDMERDGIERARLYLMEICKIDLSGLSKKWSEMKKLNEIRNCITQGLTVTFPGRTTRRSSGI